ncbi:hypothetical protein ABZ845_18695 [Streptomyces sp. NPDC047022]|uniref:hypothetical protein n=1 Tax=Streptomyces sp. NPDC047022 TaxID=3155737 RepID=UPI0033D2B60B
MEFRHAMKGRRALSAVAITSGLLLTVAGCGGGGGSKSDERPPASARSSGGERQESQTPQSNPVLAEVKGESGLTLTITSAKRDAGGFVTVEGSVTNNTNDIWLAQNWRGDERELTLNGSSVAGASLIDQKGKKKYLVLRDTTGRCLCTKFDGPVKQGQTADWFAQFPAPPQGTAQVDFEVGAMPPASIDISEG